MDKVTTATLKLSQPLLALYLQTSQYRDQSDLAFMLLIKSQHLDEPLDIEEMMRYSSTPVPHSLGTADGFFTNTNKAAMLHFLLEDAPEDVPYPTHALFIQVGNALFHAMTNLPPAFGVICLRVYSRYDS